MCRWRYRLPSPTQKGKKKKVVKIINLTPHAVRFQRADGTLTDLVPPAPQPAWVASRVEERTPIDGIPVRRQVRGGVVGVPAPESDTIYVVSSVVSQALLEEGAQRDDVYVPVDVVRDENGQPTYARGLAQLGRK